jgi:hypothetical protein
VAAASAAVEIVHGARHTRQAARRQLLWQMPAWQQCRPPRSDPALASRRLHRRYSASHWARAVQHRRVLRCPGRSSGSQG